MLKKGLETSGSGGNDDVQHPKDHSEPDAEAHKPCIMYRVEYRYGDGEIAYEKEGSDEADLFLERPTPVSALPPITVTTVFSPHIPPTERSRKSKQTKSSRKSSEKGKETTDNQKGTPDKKEEDADIEDFPDSRAEKYMTIHSKKLLNALRAVVTYYPGSSGIGLLLLDEPKVYEPYWILCHHMKDLRRYKDSQPPWHDEEYRKECNQHLDLLLDFLDHHYGKALQDEEARWARSIPVCTFEYLWLLLKPGEACYHVDEDESNPYITKEVKLSNRNRYWIDAWNIDFDGHQVGRCTQHFCIPRFDGEKNSYSIPSSSTLKPKKACRSMVARAFTKYSSQEVENSGRWPKWVMATRNITGIRQFTLTER